MMLRALAGAMVLVTASASAAFAAGPAPAPPPPAPGSSAAVIAAPAAAGHGAIVVAVSDEAAGAAHALALDVYRDAELRPSIDDATARVLAGEAPGADAPQKLKDAADVRATLAKSFPTSAAPATGAPAPPGDASARRLLASLGADYHAELVVAVFLDGGRPVARVIRPGSASFERVELGAALETPENGPKIVKWPGATILLKGMVAPAAPPAPIKPVAVVALPPPPAPTQRPFYKSPWFWGTAGVVAAAGVTVLVLSKTTSGSDTTHLGGHVGP
jgi:hypothetical protein